MTAQLSPELERFVEEEVHSGHFASREAVIETALWDMQPLGEPQCRQF